MVDNVAITAGSGTTIAADDVGGVLTQRVKVQWGPDGTVNDADVASGKPLPVQHRVSDGTAWTYGSGAIGSGTPRVALATDSPGVTALGQATMSGSLPVAMASDQSNVPVKLKSGTGTQANVSAAATDTSILATNSARLGATIFNDSTSLLYLLVGTGTSSSTVHTVQVQPGGYYEVPFGYTGVIKGIWAAANGSARVTEFT